MRYVDVSVVVCNYNYGHLIRRCIRSLLNQHFPFSYEIIVVDDCSTDDSIKALQPFVDDKEIRLIQSKNNLGIGGSAKVGVDNSRGKYIVRVDSDDYVQPGFLYLLYSFLRYNPDYVAVSCDHFSTDNDEKVLSTNSFKDDPVACGLMFRTSYLERIGSYNCQKKVFEDVDLYKRIDKDKLFHMPIPLYHYVKHGESVTDKIKEDNDVK